MDGISKHQMVHHSVPSRKRPSQESECHASSESGQLPRGIASAALELLFFTFSAVPYISCGRTWGGDQWQSICLACIGLQPQLL